MQSDDTSTLAYQEVNDRTHSGVLLIITG